MRAVPLTVDAEQYAQDRVTAQFSQLVMLLADELASVVAVMLPDGL